jgi:hypothetical protein
MLFYIINYFSDHLFYIIGCIIQLTCISLPVSLKNWEDDTLNSLTYISFQLFVAGVIFIIAPWIFEVKSVTLWVQVMLLGSTGFVAIFRVIKIIPFEFTFTTKVSAPPKKDLVFSGFNSSDRHAMLASLNFSECDAELRYNALRERLIRVRIAGKENAEDADLDEEQASG